MGGCGGDSGAPGDLSPRGAALSADSPDGQDAPLLRQEGTMSAPLLGFCCGCFVGVFLGILIIAILIIGRGER